jgi:hypothetical protein
MGDKMKKILELICIMVTSSIIGFLLVWSIISLIKCPNMSMDINGYCIETRNYETQ